MVFKITAIEWNDFFLPKRTYLLRKEVNHYTDPKLNGEMGIFWNQNFNEATSFQTKEDAENFIAENFQGQTTSYREIEVVCECYKSENDEKLNKWRQEYRHYKTYAS